MLYQKSKKLNPGDTVAIVSPSWGGPSVFPAVYENGLKVLKEWGLNIKEFPTTRMSADQLRLNPKLRAEDLNSAFADSEVKAIFASIGGEDSVRLLPFLNPQIIAANPKILMGFSDTTTLHVFCNLLGITTFYGPSIMAGFSQMESLPPEYQAHVKAMLFEPKATHAYEPYKQYCDGYLEWAKPENLGKTKELKTDDGWHWLQGTGKTQGQLFGGCIEVLQMLNGTDYWPNKNLGENFWNGKILLLETSEEKMTVDAVGHVLRNYGMQGIFNKISGLIFGRAMKYTSEEKHDLEQKILFTVAKEFNHPNLPIIANFDFGHTDPQLIMPLGIKTEIDCQNKIVKLIENWLE